MIKGDYIHVGEIIQTKGIIGEVIIASTRNSLSNFFATGFLFIEINKDLIPFFVESFDVLSSDKSKVKFEDINNPEQAKFYMHHKVFMLKESIMSEHGSNDNVGGMVGYKIISDKGNEIGVVFEIIENSHQLLFLVKDSEKEILIPAVEEYISNINEEEKVLTMDLPDGLLDL